MMFACNDIREYDFFKDYHKLLVSLMNCYVDNIDEFSKNRCVYKNLKLELQETLNDALYYNFCDDEAIEDIYVGSLDDNWVLKIRISFRTSKVDAFDVYSDVYRKWYDFFEKNKLSEVSILHKHKCKFENKTDEQICYIDFWLRFTHL